MIWNVITKTVLTINWHSRTNSLGTSSVAPGGSGHFLLFPAKYFSTWWGIYRFLHAIENQSPPISRGGGMGRRWGGDGSGFTLIAE